jgi:hypothetical protein
MRSSGSSSEISIIELNRWMLLPTTALDWRLTGKKWLADIDLRRQELALQLKAQEQTVTGFIANRTWLPTPGNADGM